MEQLQAMTVPTVKFYLTEKLRPIRVEAIMKDGTPDERYTGVLMPMQVAS